jgi:peroxiredoxin
MKWFESIFGGPKDMTALPSGTKAPDFSLPMVVRGKNEPAQRAKDSDFSLQAAFEKGPVLAAFFKVSCPTCQYAFPFLERIHKALSEKEEGEKKITIVGISQNNQADTAAFLKEYGVTFPIVLDNPNGYAVSNAYGLTNVPTLFLIGQDGEIEITSIGWNKGEVSEINRKLAAARESSPAAIFQPGEEVREFRAG